MINKELDHSEMTVLSGFKKRQVVAVLTTASDRRAAPHQLAHTPQVAGSGRPDQQQGGALPYHQRPVPHRRRSGSAQ
jgi:hypothetical protein